MRRGPFRMIAAVFSVIGATITGGLWFMSAGADVLSMITGQQKADPAPVAAPAPAPAAPAPVQPVAAASAPELDRCTVIDPTPTALNVRSKPGGDSVGRLSNGVTVRVLRRDTHNGKPWALIEPVSGNGPTGWAFAQFLACDGEP